MGLMCLRLDFNIEGAIRRHWVGSQLTEMSQILRKGVFQPETFSNYGVSMTVTCSRELLRAVLCCSCCIW
jgi:hypothetical protein